MAISTKPASGFRDFLPTEARRRHRVFEVIRHVYEAHGFEPLETPCFERLSTLMGKYGEEGDQLLFKVLQRGNKLERALEKEAPTELDLADMGLRYDLTVPLARVYARHQNDLPRYFKRYQLAPVWRADRPQRGRFREFYQCDVDVIGSESMIVEAEVCGALSEVLDRLGFAGARIHINHRALLSAMLESAGVASENETDALIALDKLDKIGPADVVDELHERGVSEGAVDALMEMMAIASETSPDASSNERVLAAFEERIGHLESGARAISELRQILQYSAHGPAGARLMIDPTLARGLSYYTGAIFEIRSDDFPGSLGGGGRYDGLIGMFMSKQSVPACGFSLGIERLLVLMEERGTLDDEPPSVDVLVTVWDEERIPHSLRLAAELRQAGLRVDVYPQPDKYGKQFRYADERRVPVVAILAPDEIEQGVVALKQMGVEGDNQRTVARAECVETIMELIGRSS